MLYVCVSEIDSMVRAVARKICAMGGAKICAPQEKIKN